MVTQHDTPRRSLRRRIPTRQELESPAQRDTPGGRGIAKTAKPPSHASRVAVSGRCRDDFARASGSRVEIRGLNSNLEFRAARGFRLGARAPQTSYQSDEPGLDRRA